MNDIKNRAKKISNNIFKENSSIRSKLKINDAIPFKDINGDTIAWFVPLTMENKLIGFLKFDTGLEYISYYSFQRNKNNIEECPNAQSWLDKEYIKSQAKTKVSSDDTLSEPVFTFDKNPSRFVWLVNVKTKNGEKRKIFLTGDFLYFGD